MASKLRQEVLQLYREVLRTARVFRLQPGQPKIDYYDKVRKSARSELDEARHLISSEDIIQRIVTARAALHQVQEKIANKVNGDKAN